MNTPDPPQYAPDPMLVQQEQKANSDQFAALQTRAQGDTASLMARFGTLAAYAGAQPGSSSSPIASVLSAGTDPYAGTMFAGKFGATLASTVKTV